MKQQKAHYCLRQEAGTDIYKLYIYDNVSEYGTFDWWEWEYTESETSAKYFRKELAKIPENATIELHINSYGGSVSEGIAIYNQLKAKKCKEIIAYVDGNAYSIASVIMQAADRRIMGLGTSLLIHNMWVTISGNANELRKVADDLDTLMESNRQIYMERVSITEEELIEMMDNETYLTPDQAVEMGFADEVGKKEEPAPDQTEQLRQQLSEMRREMALRKSFQEELRQFCNLQQKKDADNEEDTENTDDSTEDDDKDEDDNKKQEKAKQFKLAALLSQAAAQYLKER